MDHTLYDPRDPYKPKQAITVIYMAAVKQHPGKIIRVIREDKKFYYPTEYSKQWMNIATLKTSAEGQRITAAIQGARPDLHVVVIPLEN